MAPTRTGSSRVRRHPYLTFWLGFVIGAGYLMMSDTPPVQFFTHSWLLGLLLGVAVGVALRRPRAPSGDSRPSVVVAVGLAAVYALTGSGLGTLLAALAVELRAGKEPIVPALDRPRPLVGAVAHEGGSPR